MMKKAEMQEQEFLEICSSYDYDLLTNKIEMTLKDYQRITYLVGSLGYSQYLQFLPLFLYLLIYIMNGSDNREWN